MATESEQSCNCIIEFEQSCNCIICCLPTSILVEIAAKVASQSLADLHHLKLTSKEIMNITEDDYVYKHASLDKVPLVLKPETIPQRQASFLSRCRSSGNLESLYREGMEQYLCDEFLCNEGLDTLRMAAQKGHKRSMYAFAMTVLVCQNTTAEYQSSFKEEALGYLRFLRNQKCLIKCRKDYVEFVSKFRQFMRPCVVRYPRKLLCDNDLCDDSWTLKITSWGINSEDDDEKIQDMCENCRWDYELGDYFYFFLV
ncbi:hypothetical protein K1719_033583 [Acacia pycnantha]|nr:hypothetical protein K1719_033583 [Acacia pycnantha]